MVRAAAKNHPSVAIVTSPDRYADVLRRGGRGRLHPRAAPSGWPPRRSRTPRRTTSPWPRWMGTVLTDTSGGEARASRRSPAPPGRRRPTLRYGENPHQRAALYSHWRGRASPRPSSCTARRCPTTTTSTPTPPAAPPTTSTSPAVAIIKHANPCGIAVGADVAEAHRKAHACDPVSAFGGVIAVNRPVTVEMAEQVAEIFTEVVVAPGYEDGARRGAASARRTSGSWSAPPTAPATASRPGRSPAACCCRQADRVDAPGDDPSTWTLATGEAASPRGPRRPGVRVAGLPRGEVQRDPAGRRTAPRSASAWARSTGSTPAASRSSGPGSGPRARSPPPTRSSRSRTARRSCSTPVSPAVVQPGGSVRDELSRRGRQEGRRDHVPHRYAALLPLTGAAEPTRSTARTTTNRLTG